MNKYFHVVKDKMQISSKGSFFGKKTTQNNGTTRGTIPSVPDAAGDILLP